eukprot:SAG31_NODE_6907_length_1855_cov_1.791002_2_plen_83_part_00
MTITCVDRYVISFPNSPSKLLALLSSYLSILTQGGDTHKMFKHLDDDDSGHLTDEEMYTLVGVPKGHEVHNLPLCTLMIDNL